MESAACPRTQGTNDVLTPKQACILCVFSYSEMNLESQKENPPFRFKISIGGSLE